ncbi:MAG: PAS domain-containing sensor histidine kinase, partial [Leptothrix sp. (in: b-proteobacteria)]
MLRAASRSIARLGARPWRRAWQRWWPRSLVGRVFALYSVTLLLFVLGGIGLFYRYQFAVELEDAQLRAEALSAVMQPTISDNAVIGDYDAIRRTLERAVFHSSFASAAFIDLRGGVVQAPRNDLPDVVPPRWLRDSVAARLYDANLPISVGGTDYGVLRLRFAPDRIAGRLWQQTRIALALGVLSVIAGLMLIRLPLVRWLGKLGQVQAFEQALRSGEALPALRGGSDDAPVEFRQTFDVLERTAASLRAELATRESALIALRQVLEGLMPGAQGGPSARGTQAAAAHAAPMAGGGDDLAAISALIAELVHRLQVRGEQLDAIFALSADGFVSFDAQRRVNYVSPAFVRLTDLSEARVLGADEAGVEALLRVRCSDAPVWP